MDKLIRLAVEKRGLTFILTALVAVFGWVSFQNLPIDAVPDITNVQVQVNTAVKGLVPEEIEKFVTYPIESEMGGIPGVDEIRSVTRFGLSQVTIVFEEEFDIFLARQLIAEKLQSIKDELPSGVQPQLGPISTGLGEIFFYSLEAKNPAEGEERLRQLMELRALNEWVVKPRILTVKGIAEVNVIGGFEKQYYVKPRMSDLARYGIHFDEVVEALEKNNRNTGGGYIQQTAEQLLVQAKGLVESPEEIETIVIKKLPSFETVTIGDVADVGLDKEIRTGAALVGGKEAVLGTAMMLLGENSRKVAQGVEEKLEEIKKSLPNWVEMETIYTRSTLVDRTLFTVEKNLLFGAILVAIILLILMGNLRVAVITAVTIPLSLLATFILMKYFNVSGNLMSLGALDFGIIVDGAVIVIDNCVRLVSQRAKELKRTLSRDEIKNLVIQATIEIRSAAGFGQLIIIIVFLPIFALTGVEAKMFTPMAATFCFALGAAFVFSFTTVPALAATFLSTRIPGRRSQTWVMEKLEGLYLPVLRMALKAKTLVIVTGLIAVGVGAFLFSRLGADFLPQLDEGSIAIQFVRPTNISIDQSVALQAISEEVILEFPEVERVFSRLGTAEVATDPMGVNISDTYALFKPEDKWPEVDGKRRTKLELIADLKKTLEKKIPGQNLIFSQPIQLRFNELLEGVRSDVALKIYGDDMAILARLSNEAAEVVTSIPGAGDSEAEVKGTSPVLRIEPKSEVLREYGMSKEAVHSTIESAVGGMEAGSLYQGVMRFPIIVRLGEEERSDLDLLGRLPVGVSDNLTVPLKEVADLTIQETYSDIRRESSQKRAAVMINVRGRDAASFVEEAQKAVEAQLELPTGYYMEWGGSFKNLERAKSRLMLVVPIALLLIFVMIYLAFGSILQTLIIFACIPMALVGGVLGLMVNDLDFSISAGIGFIALSGIAVLNGVVLVSFFNKLKLDGLTGDELILEGAKLRLRPVLMTASAAAFGFLPMMFSTGSGAEVQRPLASVVVGGIISATLLTLVVVPSVYRLLESKMKVTNSGMSH